jgi:hypothetical protein
MKFYVGLHQPGDGQHFEQACISINRLVGRRKPIGARLLVDSGAFSELARHGRYRSSVADYAEQLRALDGVAEIDAAVTQDYMCEGFMLARTGLTVADHQRLTIERYDALLAEGLPFPIMPVLQGYTPAEYRDHVLAYGDRLTPGMWVGVGSVCKRNSAPGQIVAVLSAIAELRPDLRLHGFGVKRIALVNAGVREMLFSADSMAWSFAARYEGRDANSWREAKSFADQVDNAASLPAEPWQMPLPFWKPLETCFGNLWKPCSKPLKSLKANSPLRNICRQ